MIRKSLRRLYEINIVRALEESAATYVPLVMVSRGLAFLRTLLVARILGRQDYQFGLYQPALELINPIVALVMFGAADVAERYVWRIQFEQGPPAALQWLFKQFVRILAAGLGAATLLICFSPWISVWVWGVRSVGLLAACGATVIVLALYQHVAATLRGLRAYGAAAGMELMGAILLIFLSGAAAFRRDAIWLVGAYGISVMIPWAVYARVVCAHLRDDWKVNLKTREERGPETETAAPAAVKTNITRFAMWALVRLLLVMAFGFLSMWGVRFLADRGGDNAAAVSATGQYAMGFRIAQLLAFVAVTLWASAYGIAVQAWSNGQVKRAKVQLFRMGRFGMAALSLAAVGLLVCRGIFAWLLPTYAEAIVTLLPGLLAVFIWYALLAFFSGYADLREQPERGAILWGVAVGVQLCGILICRVWGAGWADPKDIMLAISAVSLGMPLVVAAPGLLLRPLKFSATGMPLAVLGAAAVTLFCPEWVVNWIAGPVLAGAVLFLYGAGLLVRPMDRRAFRRWRTKRLPSRKYE